MGGDMAETNNTGLSWAQMLQETQKKQENNYDENQEEQVSFSQVNEDSYQELSENATFNEKKEENSFDAYDSIDEAMFITPEQMKAGVAFPSSVTENETPEVRDSLEEDKNNILIPSISKNELPSAAAKESFETQEEVENFADISQIYEDSKELDMGVNKDSFEQEKASDNFFSENTIPESEEISQSSEDAFSSLEDVKILETNKKTDDSVKEKVESENKESLDFEEDIGIYPVRGNKSVQSHNYALLAQIASEEEVVEKKERPKLQIHIFALLMSMVFTFDAFKKKHPEIFKKIEMSWRVGIFFILGTGLISFIFMSYIFISFPRFVKTYLDVSGIEVYDFEVRNVSPSKVEIENIRSKDGSFTIALLTLNYSVPDLIQGKIKNAFLDGVQIYLDTEKPYWNMQNFYKLYTTSFLSKILTIENVIIEKGDVSVSHDKESIPIQISMGNYFYDGTLKSDISFKTQENEYLDLEGAISLQGKENLELELKLDAGKFVEDPEKNYSGLILSKLEKDGLKDLKLNLNIKEKEETTNISSDIQISDGKLNGKIDFNIKDRVSDVKELEKQFSIKFSDLLFEKTGRIISTEKPLSLIVNRFETQGLKLRNVGAKLDGILSCENYACAYRLEKESNVEVNQLELKMNGDIYTSVHPIVFAVLPSKENNLVSRDKKGNLEFNILTKNIVFDGYINTDSYPISLELHDVELSKKDLKSGILFKTNGKRLRTNEYELGAFLISITDPLAVAPSGKIELEKVRFLNPKAFLKVPFSLSVELRRDGNSVHLSALDKLIEADFIGSVDVLKRNFKGKVRMKPIRLEDLKVSLDEIYPYFPSGASNVSGLFAIQGELDYKSPTQVSGPLSVLIENVNGSYKNARVEGLSTLLSVEELAPFATKEREDIFVARINSPLPIRNLQMSAKLDSSSISIEKGQADLGEIPVQIESTQIPYDMPNPLVYLQNNRVDLKKIVGALDIPYAIDMTGFASLNLPIYLRESGLEIQNGEIELPDVLLMVKGEKKPSFFKDSNTFKVMNSAITVNSVPQTDKVKLFVNLEDDNVVVRRRFRKLFEVNLDSLLKPASNRPIPNEIMMKMQMFEK